VRILGIDPGPTGYAWALFDSDRNEIVEWGDNPSDDLVLDYDHVAIEDIVSVWHQGRTVIETAKMIGRLQKVFPDAIMIPRKTVAAVLGGNARAGDQRINAALNRYIPSLARRRKGLNGHHRAAAAVAFVALGRIQKQKIEEAYK